MTRSTARAAAPSSRSTKREAKRPSLRLVDPQILRARTRRRRVAVVSVLLLVAGMFVVALAHAQLVQNQRELDQLRARMAETERQRADLEEDVVFASSPKSVVSRARDLGMVRAVDPQYIVAVRPLGDS